MKLGRTIFLKKRRETHFFFKGRKCKGKKETDQGPLAKKNKNERKTKEKKNKQKRKECPSYSKN